MSSSSENGGCMVAVIGFVLGAGLMYSGVNKKLEEAQKYKGQVQTLRKERDEAKAEAIVSSGDARSLRSQISAAEARVATAEQHLVTARDQHNRELALVEQKARVEERLAGIEEGKAIAESLIEQLVADKKESSALISRLNQRVGVLVEDLNKQLASVETLVAEQTNRVASIGYFTISLILFCAILLTGIVAITVWYLREREQALRRFTVAAVIGSGFGQSLISLRKGVPRSRLIAHIEDDLRAETEDEREPNEFRFETGEAQANGQ